MASSGVVTYTVNEAIIIQDALEDIGAVGAGETVAPEDYVKARRKLNMLVKQWSGMSDFAPGLKMWTRKRAFLFMQKDQVKYSIGPSGDAAAADSFVRTSLSVNAALGAGSVTLASVTGVANGYNIGILLSSGSIQWTAVNGAPVGNVVTLGAVLTASALSGSTVYVYQNKPRRPLEILTANMRTSADQDTPMEFYNLQQYEAVGNKTSPGIPDSLYYEAQLTNGVIYLNRSPNDLTRVIPLVFLSPPEDFVAQNDTADYPQEWYRALGAQLSIDCAPAFEKPVSADLRQARNEAVQIAQNANPQTSALFFAPNQDGYA